MNSISSAHGIVQTQGAQFWLQVVTELGNWGEQDTFIACIDGLKGFPEAIEVALPESCGSFPNDETLLKLFYLMPNNISKRSTILIWDWEVALNQFAIELEGRSPQQLEKLHLHKIRDILAICFSHKAWIPAKTSRPPPDIATVPPAGCPASRGRCGCASGR
jgi:hypothetical protein